MASRELRVLFPPFREKLEEVIAELRLNQIEVLVHCTLRTVDEQARIWRSTRTTLEVVQKIDKLRARGFGFLADVIERVGPQQGVLGKHKTLAGPGESFHNYGMAVDLVVMDGGKPDWDGVGPKWTTLGGIVAASGLEWAGSWTTFRESGHVQLGAGANPLKLHPPERIKSMLDAALAQDVE